MTSAPPRKNKTVPSDDHAAKPKKGKADDAGKHKKHKEEAAPQAEAPFDDPFDTEEAAEAPPAAAAATAPASAASASAAPTAVTATTVAESNAYPTKLYTLIQQILADSPIMRSTVAKDKHHWMNYVDENDKLKVRIVRKKGQAKGLDFFWKARDGKEYTFLTNGPFRTAGGSTPWNTPINVIDTSKGNKTIDKKDGSKVTLKGGPGDQTWEIKPLFRPLPESLTKTKWLDFHVLTEASNWFVMLHRDAVIAHCLEHAVPGSDKNIGALFLDNAKYAPADTKMQACRESKQLSIPLSVDKTISEKQKKYFDPVEIVKKYPGLEHTRLMRTTKYTQKVFSSEKTPESTSDADFQARVLKGLSYVARDGKTRMDRVPNYVRVYDRFGRKLPIVDGKESFKYGDMTMVQFTPFYEDYEKQCCLKYNIENVVLLTASVSKRQTIDAPVYDFMTDQDMPMNLPALPAPPGLLAITAGASDSSKTDVSMEAGAVSFPDDE